MTSHLAGLIEALERGGGTHSIADVLDQIDRGEAQMWANEGGVIVTEIHVTPRMKVCHFWLAAGEKEAVVGLSREVLEWAKGQGCERATLSGRKGWERELASEGWAPMLTLMGRVL